MEIIMRKILTQQFMGVLAGLASIILSVTLYAYKGDQERLNDKILQETVERKNADTQIKYECDNNLMEHEKLDQVRYNALLEKMEYMLEVQQKGIDELKTEIRRAK